MKRGEYYLVRPDHEVGVGEATIEGPFASTPAAVAEIRAQSKASSVSDGDEFAVVRVQRVIRIRTKAILFPDSEEPDLVEKKLPEQPAPLFGT